MVFSLFGGRDKRKARTAYEQRSLSDKDACQHCTSYHGRNSGKAAGRQQGAPVSSTSFPFCYLSLLFRPHGSSQPSMTCSSLVNHLQRLSLDKSASQKGNLTGLTRVRCSPLVHSHFHQDEGYKEVPLYTMGAGSGSHCTDRKYCVCTNICMYCPVSARPDSAEATLC